MCVPATLSVIQRTIARLVCRQLLIRYRMLIQLPRMYIISVRFRHLRLSLSFLTIPRLPVARDGLGNVGLIRPRDGLLNLPGCWVCSNCSLIQTVTDVLCMSCVGLFVDQEDEQGEHVACKYCLKSSPVLVRRKKNHEQVLCSVFLLPCLYYL
jgi:hypothetical protein